MPWISSETWCSNDEPDPSWLNSPVGPVKVIEYSKTCDARPTQWEGLLEDGRVFYARYRDEFSLSIFERGDFLRGGEPPVLEKDGEVSADALYMTEREMIDLTADHLDFSAAVLTGYREWREKHGDTLLWGERD